MVEQSQDAQSAPLWRVGVPVQTMVPNVSKGYVPGWEIPVIMADNSSFTVTVSAMEFTPEIVQQKIEEHVNKVVAIRSLQGPTY